MGDPFWLAEFEIVEAGTVDAVWERLGATPNAAYIGNETDRAAAAGLTVNPDELVVRLAAKGTEADDHRRTERLVHELEVLVGELVEQRRRPGPLPQVNRVRQHVEDQGVQG